MTDNLNQEAMLSIEYDKLSDNFSIRVPAITKKHLDRLTPAQKKILNEKILFTISKVLHDADFNPTKYLKEE